MMNLKEYPTPVAGLALGLSGISLFWALTFSGSALGCVILLAGCGLAACLLTPVLMKFVRHPKQLLVDIQHPTLGSVVPTSAMALMLLSYPAGLLFHPLAIVMWSVAVVAHVAFFLLFAFFRLRSFDLNHVVPSWFVPPIGIVVACLTVPSAFGFPIAHVLLYFGLISYVVLLPVVLYRLGLGSAIESARRPTLAILAAPASLTLAGYLTLVAMPNPLLVLVLFSVAILMTGSVYLMLFHLLRLPYTPAYAAYTFPLAIGATAMMKFSHWASRQTLFQGYVPYLHRLAILEGIVAALIIVYVLAHTLRFLFHKPNASGIVS